ncbi:hypothetical protein CABS01_02691 [Colletotrichum abscissum]|uniref:uncharacterized protein n=1 Tax=Colletotrichum abscissum TaxID=1671311 RepID=UPI0027D5CD73|nr:uncharacterized protein CABS01_02691 [Colletotrichum abscissum]KAK1482955.1 hypothetical protein CABS01_02691 [Colletotrichum abscissum]
MSWTGPGRSYRPQAARLCSARPLSFGTSRRSAETHHHSPPIHHTHRCVGATLLT